MSAVPYIDSSPKPAQKFPAALYLIDTERPSPQSILQSSTLLNALTQEEIDRLSMICRVCRAERGEFIWLDGSTCDFFGIAGTGFVKMVRSNHEGVDTTLELMGPGQVFGLSGTITGRGCPLAAVAVTGLWYLKVPKNAFMDIYRNSTPMKDRMVRRLIVRLHNSLDLFGRMTSGRVDERIAAILFILAESYGERKSGKLTLRVPLTRQEIAEMAGTTVESAIRTMSRWQKNGWLSTGHHYITMLDEVALGKLLTH